MLGLRGSALLALLALLPIPPGLTNHHAHTGVRAQAPQLSDCVACDPPPVGPTLDDRARVLAGLGPGNLSAVPQLSFFYCGWISWGNMGDELVHIMLVEHIKQMLTELYGGKQHISTEFRYSADMEKQLPRLGGHLAAQADGFILGGGSLFGNLYVNMMAGSHRGQPFLSYGTGWFGDDHDKPAMQQGLQKLLGDNTTARLYGGVRGPVTASYMEEQYGYRWPVIGDSGFLIAELLPANSAYLTNVLGLEHYNNRPYVVVSPPTGADYFYKSAKTAADQGHNVEYSSAFRLFLVRLLATHRVVIFPPDPDAEADAIEFMKGVEQLWHKQRAEDPAFTAPGGPNGEAAACSLAAQCERPALQMVHHGIGLSELVSLYRHADFSISSRFHPGVVSLATLTPNMFVCLHTVRCKSKYDDSTLSVFGKSEWLVTWETHLKDAGSESARADVFMAEAKRLMANRADVVAKAKDAVITFREAYRKALRDYWAAVCARAPQKCEAIARSRFVRVTSLKMHLAAILAVEGDG